MIKKIIFILALCCLIISCGKKGDPTYKDPERETLIKRSIIDKV
tara:strand:+ start:392 stop:523 length:132 start_codon:yes stop_codon:yes gene_type:complete